MKKLLLLFLLAGCAKHVPAHPGMRIVRDYKWSYKTPDERTFYIFAQTDDAFHDALKAIGCGACTVEQDGVVYIVEKLK